VKILKTVRSKPSLESSLAGVMKPFLTSLSDLKITYEYFDDKISQHIDNLPAVLKELYSILKITYNPETVTATISDAVTEFTKSVETYNKIKNSGILRQEFMSDLTEAANQNWLSISQLITQFKERYPSICIIAELTGLDSLVHLFIAPSSNSVEDSERFCGERLEDLSKRLARSCKQLSPDDANYILALIKNCPKALPILFSKLPNLSTCSLENLHQLIGLYYLYQNARSVVAATEIISQSLCPLLRIQATTGAIKQVDVKVTTLSMSDVKDLPPFYQSLLPCLVNGPSSIITFSQYIPIMVKLFDKTALYYQLLSKHLFSIENKFAQQDITMSVIKNVQSCVEAITSCQKSLGSKFTLGSAILSLPSLAPLEQNVLPNIEALCKLADNPLTFSITDSLIKSCTVNIFKNPATQCYTYTLSTENKSLQALEVESLTMRLKQLATSQPTEEYKSMAKAFSDVRVIIIESIDILDYLNMKGALVNLTECGNEVAGVTPGNDSIQIVLKITEANSKIFNIGPLQVLWQKLKEIREKVNKSDSEILADSKLQWIARLYGSIKITFANWVLNPQAGKEEEVASILRYLFQDSKIGEFKKLNNNFVDIKKSPLSTEVLKQVKIVRHTTNRMANQEDETIAFSKQKPKYHGYDGNKYDALFSYVLLLCGEDISLDPMQFLHLSMYSTKQEILSFLSIALSDHKRHYFILDIHLVNSDLRSLMVKTIKEKVESEKNINPNLLLLMPADSDNKVFKEFFKYDNFLTEIKQSQLKSSNMDQTAKSFENLLKRCKSTIVTSNFAGNGKTHYIKRQAQNPDKLLPLFLSGEVNPVSLSKRFALVSSLIKKTKSPPYTIMIRLDMMDNLLNNIELIDQLLFKICFLKCVQIDGGFLFFSDEDKIFIELGNNYKSVLKSGLPFLSTLEKYTRNFYDIPCIPFDNPANFTFNPKIQLMLNRVCSIYQHYKENRDYRVTPEVLAQEQQQLSSPNPAAVQPSLPLAQQITLLKEFFSLPQAQGGRPRNPLQGTMSQIVSLITILYIQFKVMYLMSALNFDNYIGEIQQVIDGVKRARKTLAQFVFQLSNNFVWSQVELLREESNKSKKIKEELMSLKDTANQMLATYRRQLKIIPKWEGDQLFGIYFSRDALKLIYKVVADIPNDIKFVIEFNKNPMKALRLDGQVFTPQEYPIKEYTSIKQENELQTFFIDQLIEAFSLVIMHKFYYLRPTQDHNFSEAATKNYLKDRTNTFEGGKGFSLTMDTYLKILIICQRAEVNVPVVLMGATGCGKTYLVRYIAKVLFNESILELTLHSGVKEDEVEKKVLDAIAFARREPVVQDKGQKRIWVFFDEFNTSPLQSLIEELMCSRTASFSQRISEEIAATKTIPSNIVFVAACNPFRVKAKDTNVGLIHESQYNAFSHSVYPLPESLINYAWDFGQLKPETEADYIRRKLGNSNKLAGTQGLTDALKETIVEIITTAQLYLRNQESDNTVSLRDAERFIDILIFAVGFLKPFNERLVEPAILFTTFLCYFMRVGEQEKRLEMDNSIRAAIEPKINKEYLNTLPDKRFSIMAGFEIIMNSIIEDIRSSGKIPNDVAESRALKENLVALVVSFATTVPLMICGKPGTSKTLSCLIIYEYLNSELKRNSKYFKTFPRVEYENFSGSRLTTSKNIQEFHQRCIDRKAELRDQNQNDIVVFLFDEMGLAEIGFDNPLKILHPILEPENGNREIVFVGVSNWKLDLSKMSRALFVARPDPGVEDLILMCMLPNIGNELLKQKITALAKAYLKFIENEQQEGKAQALMNNEDEMGDGVQSSKPTLKSRYYHPNFFGLRDWYHLAKYLNRHFQEFTTISEKIISGSKSASEIYDQLIINGLYRNFSGKICMNRSSNQKEVLSSDLMVTLYRDELKLRSQSQQPHVIDLISQNLVDKESRFLMVFTENPSVNDMLVKELYNFCVKQLRYGENMIKYINKSQDKDLLPIIDQLPNWIESGYVLIMKDADELYSCLYEVLNQRYTTTTTGQEDNKKCFIHLAQNKEPIPVTINPRFRIIIMMKREDDIHSVNECKHPAPFLNRCEKQLVLYEDLIDSSQKKLKEALEKKYDLRSKEFAQFPPFTTIHNFSLELMYSIALSGSNHLGEMVKRSMTEFFEQRLKELLKPSAQRNSGQAISIEAAEQKLVSLYSKNMLLLRMKNEGNSDWKLTKPILQQFYESHIDDSFESLVARLNTLTAPKRKEMTKMIIFTLSQFLDLDQAIKPFAKDCKIVTPEEFLSIKLLDRDSVVQEFVNTNKFVFFRLKGRSEWNHADIIRSTVDSLKSIPQGHYIWIIAHHSYKDLCLKNSVETSITFMTESWKQLVIDDLLGSNYKWFVETLENTPEDFLKKCDDSLFQANESQDIKVFRKLVLDALEDFLQSKQASVEHKFDYLEICKLKEKFASSKDILKTMLTAIDIYIRQSNPISQTTKVFELIPKQGPDSTVNKIDCTYFIEKVIFDCVKHYLKESLETITKVISLKPLLDSNILSEKAQSDIVSKWCELASNLLNKNNEEEFKGTIGFQINEATFSLDAFTNQRTLNGFYDDVQKRKDEFERSSEESQMKFNEWREEFAKKFDSIMEAVLSKTPVHGISQEDECKLTKEEISLAQIDAIRIYYKELGEEPNPSIIRLLLDMTDECLNQQFRFCQNPLSLGVAAAVCLVILYKPDLDSIRLEPDDRLSQEQLNQILEPFKQTRLLTTLMKIIKRLYIPNQSMTNIDQVQEKCRQLLAIQDKLRKESKEEFVSILNICKGLSSVYNYYIEYQRPNLKELFKTVNTLETKRVSSHEMLVELVETLFKPELLKDLDAARTSQLAYIYLTALKAATENDVPIELSRKLVEVGIHSLQNSNMPISKFANVFANSALTNAKIDINMKTVNLTPQGDQLIKILQNSLAEGMGNDKEIVNEISAQILSVLSAKLIESNINYKPQTPDEYKSALQSLGQNLINTEKKKGSSLNVQELLNPSIGILFIAQATESLSSNSKVNQDLSPLFKEVDRVITATGNAGQTSLSKFVKTHFTNSELDKKKLQNYSSCQGILNLIQSEPSTYIMAEISTSAKRGQNDGIISKIFGSGGTNHLKNYDSLAEKVNGILLQDKELTTIPKDSNSKSNDLLLSVMKALHPLVQQEKLFCLFVSNLALVVQELDLVGKWSLKEKKVEDFMTIKLKDLMFMERKTTFLMNFIIKISKPNLKSQDLTPLVADFYDMRKDTNGSLPLLSKLLNDLLTELVAMSLSKLAKNEKFDSDVFFADADSLFMKYFAEEFSENCKRIEEQIKKNKQMDESVKEKVISAMGIQEQKQPVRIIQNLSKSPEQVIAKLEAAMGRYKSQSGRLCLKFIVDLYSKRRLISICNSLMLSILELEKAIKFTLNSKLSYKEVLATTIETYIGRGTNAFDDMDDKETKENIIIPIQKAFKEFKMIWDKYYSEILKDYPYLFELKIACKRLFEDLEDQNEILTNLSNPTAILATIIVADEEPFTANNQNADKNSKTYTYPKVMKCIISNLIDIHNQILNDLSYVVSKNDKYSENTKKTARFSIENFFSLSSSSLLNSDEAFIYSLISPLLDPEEALANNVTPQSVVEELLASSKYLRMIEFDDSTPYILYKESAKPSLMQLVYRRFLFSREYSMAEVQRNYEDREAMLDIVKSSKLNINRIRAIEEEIERAMLTDGIANRHYSPETSIAEYIDNNTFQELKEIKIKNIRQFLRSLGAKKFDLLRSELLPNNRPVLDLKLINCKEENWNKAKKLLSESKCKKEICMKLPLQLDYWKYSIYELFAELKQSIEQSKITREFSKRKVESLSFSPEIIASDENSTFNQDLYQFLFESLRNGNKENYKSIINDSVEKWTEFISLAEHIVKHLDAEFNILDCESNVEGCFANQKTK